MRVGSERTVITCQVDVVRSPRVMQVEGIFDLPVEKRSVRSWEPNIRLDRPWNIGLIVGPSGSGKTTVARSLWPEEYVSGYEWSETASILDGFPKANSVKDIVNILGHVGLSSPPSWLRPYQALSTGEQFRVTLARALSEGEGIVVLDEFTSVVDRNVAQVGSAAVAKLVRKSNRQFIAVTCHEDVEEWLQPDWIYQPAVNQFFWRSLQRRPPIDISIVRTDGKAWPLFAPHHYLSASLNFSATCFLATWRGVPVAFSSWLAFPVRKGISTWREHRTVCLPDYQGVGIGNAVSDFCASIFTGIGSEAVSTTSNPAMVGSRTKSPNWRTTRPLGAQFRNAGNGKLKIDRGGKSWREKGMRSQAASAPRMTAGFRYIGPKLDRELARRLLEKA